MASFRFALFAIVVAPSLALGQPAHTPTESVTVTGTKSREVIENFVSSFATPTRMVGKIARWEDGICPITAGLRPAATRFVTKRVREVAAKVGAPVNSKESCTPNIAIVFTTKPQALLDTVRKKQAWSLGYYDSSDQLEKLATVSHPIPAWYATETKDLRGATSIDNRRGGGVELRFAIPGVPNGFTTMKMPFATPPESVTGSRLGDGLRSGFYTVIIVADPTKLTDYEIGSVSDYISMLALTQLKTLDICQQLSSIVNMLAVGCAGRADTLTDSDLGYLRGLYKMGPERTARIQRDEIAYQMDQELKSH